MSKPGDFAVIGLGRFGRAVVRALLEQHQQVLAIDVDPARVREMADEVDVALEADATDEETLRELGLDRMSCVVVTIGAKATEASILATALLRQLGVPRIIARGFNELHSRVLTTLGAHEVLNPEDEIGRRLARSLAHPGILEELELGDSIVAEVESPETFAGQTLATIDLRKRFGVSVLAIRRGGKVLANPAADDPLFSGDVLVLLGNPRSIERIAALE